MSIEDTSTRKSREPVMENRGSEALSRKEIQRYLEDREQLFSTSRTISVNEMATTLAHEMNQPIGTISNLLQGIRVRLDRGNDDNRELLLALDRAIEQTTFASNILARIRDYTHSRRPEYQPIELNALLHSCVSLLDWEIDRDAIQLTMECNDNGREQVVVMGDRTMLQQVFVNLFRNAIDAMRSTPETSRRLDIRFAVTGRQVEISVADTGSGLTQEAENNLFVPFVSTKPTGMGVGLNICRSFIELHQGKLWLSANRESGCTSYVLLPVVPAGDAETSHVINKESL